VSAVLRGYDHDKSSQSTEQLHFSLAVSTGKSCEKARDENNETVDLPVSDRLDVVHQKF
jgi:hypothetical protein